MKLPHSNNVFIPKAKLTDYILSETHAVGKFKAKYFRRLGFTEANVQLLDQALHKIAQTREVTEKISSDYGIKFLIEGTIKAPNGKNITVCTVWIIEADQDRPRFVTVYPV